MVYRAAGVLGLDPGPYTLRELMWMWEGRSEHQWDQTALLACLIANANRNPKKRRRPFAVEEFNPHTRRNAPRPKGVKATPGLMAALFCPGGPLAPVPTGRAAVGVHAGSVPDDGNG